MAKPTTPQDSAHSSPLMPHSGVVTDKSPPKPPLASEPVENAGACRHLWKIDEANGPDSPGHCAHCGEVRQFKNHIEGGYNNPWPSLRTEYQREAAASEQAARGEN